MEGLDYWIQQLVKGCLDKNLLPVKEKSLIPLGETDTIIGYILVNNKYKSSVKDVKVIPGTEIVSEHSLMLIDMMLKKKVIRKVKFRKKLEL